MSEFQHTIKNEISVSGIGIHTGHTASVLFKPAPEDTGIVFVRTDLPGSPSIQATVENVSEVTRGTTLKDGPAKVQTVEHLMAAACGMGIDNLIVEIDSDELPVGDGSSSIFTSAFDEAGLKMQEKEREYFSPRGIVSFQQGDTVIFVRPSDKFVINSTLHYDSGFLKSQFVSEEINRENFLNNIAPARTYCLESEIKEIKSKGLGKGGNVDNTIIIGDEGVTNTELRFEDEFVRHKLLDIIGDIYLLGYRLKAEIYAVKSGHSANIALAKKLKEELLTFGNSLNKLVLDSDALLNILPHRYPFLMVDRIEMDSDRRSATGYKNVTLNEPYFKGHFPDHPVFPSTLVIEFIAQSSALMFLSESKVKSRLAFFIIIEKAEFFHEVKPFDVLRSRVELVRARAKGGKVKGSAYIGDKKIATAEFRFALVDK